MLPKIHAPKTLALLMALITAGHAHADDLNAPDKVMSVRFDPRDVVKVESGDFHFKPGQLAPVHTHPAPAVGYVVKGIIIAQVEGDDPQFLKAGDAFYEPANKRILRFDNASPTEEAIFIDVNLQRKDDPFIVFPKPPTEDIDRRPLPDATYQAGVIDGVDIYNHTLQPGAQQYVGLSSPVSGYVAEGSVEIRIKGKKPQRVNAGENFHQHLRAAGAGAVVVNASADAPARVIIFSLHKQS